MSKLDPPMSLDSSCSAVHDNTLYVYGPDGFASISLKEGAEWKKLSPGEHLTGASCIGAEPADAAQAGFWVIGGTGGPSDYTGIQKYSYASSNWTTLPIAGSDVKDRQGHGATYIKADNTIMIYGGGKNGASAPSSDTFSVKTLAPYQVQSFSSSAPAAVSPILLSWSDADAVMVGGGATNNHVYLFNPNAGWRDFGTTLIHTFDKGTAQMQAAIVDGDDGSKMLYSFDMSQSPNKVDRMLVQNAKGGPVYNSAPITSRSLHRGKRELSASDWPKYNSTLAPKTTRNGFSTAQGADGQIIFTGGTDKSPIAIFDGSKNSWQNATALFLGDSESTMDVSSSTSSTTSATSTIFSTTSASTTTQTDAASTTQASSTATSTGNDHSGGMSSNTILGITLGTIAGVLVILGLILLCLRRRSRKKVQPGNADNGADALSIEKDSAIAKETFMSPSSPGFRGHHPQLSQESYSSMAILMGKMGNQKSGLAGNSGNDSRRSSVGSSHKQLKSKISKPIPQATANPMMQSSDGQGRTLTPAVRPRDGPANDQDGVRRSSGWNRYWSGGSALQILGFGGGKRKSSESDQSSRYSDTSQAHQRQTQDSATVPPLVFKEQPNMSRVNSGSPIVSQYSSRVPDGLVGRIERPVSSASSGYSSGIPESIHEAWDPTMAGKPWGSERAPSSAYAPSIQLPNDQSPARAPPPSGISQQPQLAMAAQSSDMSWLNLGDQKRV